MSGDNSKYLNTISAKMRDDYSIKRGRRTLVPGFFDGEFFEPCPNFTPGMVSPLANSNSYIMISEECGSLAKDSLVQILPTQFSFSSCEQRLLVSK